MSAAEATRWLEWLYGPEPDGLLWIGGHGDRFAGRTFTSISDAVTYGMELDAGAVGGVYHRLTTLRDIDRGRGAAVDSAYLPGFAMDLDLRGPGHKALNYPETEQELVTLLRKAGLPEPSVWVHSGGGRYPFWKLEQPADLTLPGALEEAASASAALHRLVIEWAADAGWKVDNTSDLARVYRLPGTMNRKGDQEVMAHVRWGESDISSRYALTEIGTAISRAARPVGQTPERPAPSAASASPFALPSGTYAGSDERTFTVAEAMQYVQPALDALREARDGEINNRLNDAAMRFAHFGEEFWPRDAATRELYRALEHTEYDGRTWQAEATINSAFNAMITKTGPDFWRAEYRQDPAPIVIPESTGELSRAEWLEQQLLSATALAERPAPVPLVYGRLDKDTQSWIIGEPGSFKSFVALDLAAHVAAGREWQGHRVRQERVLYLAAEGASGMTLRTRAWQKINGQMEGVDFLPLPLQVSKIDEWQALIELAVKREYGLIVIDTQARVTVGLDENTAKDAGVFIAATAALKEATRACVLVVHHTGRDGKNARGSSSIDGAQDTELKLSRAAPRSSMQVLIKDDKQKDMAEDESGLAVKLRVVDLGTDPETGRELSSLVLMPLDAWRDADATPLIDEHGQELQVPEPEPWTMALYGHNRGENVRRILQVLYTLAGETGLTKSEVERNIRSRWYDGLPLKAKRKGHLEPSSWDGSWTKARALVSASGEQVLTNPAGERWSINPSALSGLM